MCGFGFVAFECHFTCFVQDKKKTKKKKDKKQKTKKKGGGERNKKTKNGDEANQDDEATRAEREKQDSIKKLTKDANKAIFPFFSSALLQLCFAWIRQSSDLESVQAIGDASKKIKWAESLKPSLANLSNAQNLTSAYGSFFFEDF